MDSRKTQSVGFLAIFNTVLLVILLLLSSLQIATMFGLLNFNNATVRDAILSLEYEKVGGKENYEAITKLQELQLKHPQNPNNINAIKEAVKQMEASMKTENSDNLWDSFELHPEQKPQEEQKIHSVLTETERKDILKDAVIEGNKDAEIIVIEYSDMECPFCVRQMNDNQIAKKLKEEFGDKVATVFKNHRGVNHKGTERKAIAAICANRVGGAEKYSKFYHAIFNYSKENEGYYPATKLADIAKEIGLDMAKWQSCVDKKETLAQFEAETAEAMKFDLRGTPGTLIFNTKTGVYETISGAVPYAQFKNAVESLISK